MRAIQAAEPTHSACIIGHTGRGDYGHGMDLLFAERADVRVAAVADPDPAGLARAKSRIGAARAYADYREMLSVEKPTIVSVAPRQTSQRSAMIRAALTAGAHVITEKPFVQTVSEGDDLLALAEKSGRRIAVLHQIRRAPAISHLKKRVDEGFLGDLVCMRAFGKQDKRAGGEDLIVLGVHLFDIMRHFAGDPLWCHARVLQGGREAAAADAHPAGEDIGPILGDEIEAQFAFGKGILATFTSRSRLSGQSGYWGIELIGSRRSARIVADIWPRVFYSRPGVWSDAGRQDVWTQDEEDAAAGAPMAQRTTALANARVVDDFLEAIKGDRPPATSGADGLWAVEMAHAVWRSHLSGTRAVFRLKERGHPLESKQGDAKPAGA